MPHFTAHDYGFWLAAVLLAGLCLGSLATAMIHRMPRGIPMGGRARSACPHCGHGLRFYDLLPLFSYLSTLGKCRYCRAAISPAYPLVEAATAALAAGFFLSQGYHYTTPLLIVLAPVLVAIFVIDLRHMIIPDRLNLTMAGLAAAGLAAGFFILPVRVFEPLLMDALAGGAVYFLFALGLAYGFEKFLKKEALGGGDIKFFGAAGLWLGLMPLPWFLMIAGGLGVGFALAGQKCGKMGGGLFPFGPALVAALVILLLSGKSVFLTIL